MRKDLKLIEIVDTLDGRINHAQDLLTNLCRHTALVNILKTANYWAIVGGVVRDALLTNSTKDSEFFNEWEDIDIALTKFPRKGLLTRLDRKSPGVRITKNHFGGLKVHIRELGQMDLWVWKDINGLANKRDFWFEQLESVDFGINAVAFTWPTCDIIIHPQWKRDIVQSKIEKLAQESPLKQLQPIRAVALAAKMELKLHIPFELGARAKNDLYQFLYDTSEAERCYALKYLEEKLRSERWPSHTVTRFLQICYKDHCPERFTEELLKIRDEYAHSKVTQKPAQPD